MSSATSTDAGFRPWQFFVLAAFAAATAAVLIARDITPAGALLITFTLTAAGFAGLAMYRTLRPLADDDSADVPESLAPRARKALEREKQLTLRSIKELEFDHAMGKIADADFDDMRRRLRARAMMVMRQLDVDAGGYRDLIERDLAARLADAGSRRAETAGPGPRGAGQATQAPARKPCPSCETSNEPDARFCKQCGCAL